MSPGRIDTRDRFRNNASEVPSAPMIAYLRGTLLEKKPQEVVIEANNVGYRVHVPLSTYYELGKVGSDVWLHIHTQISMRQNVIALYGFRTASEHLLFQCLISVTGVGPALGLKILSGMPVESLVGLIRRGEVTRLTRIPSLGKKNAERIVVELRDKLDQLSAAPAEDAVIPVGGDVVTEDVISALTNLGYNRKVAENTVEQSLGKVSGERTLNSVLKYALGQLVR